MEQTRHRIAFIAHGRLEKTSLARNLQQVFDDYDYSLHYTQASGDAASLAASCIQRGVQSLIAVGGDGTVHEMVNGIMQHPHHQLLQKNITIGILPQGSGNDFARTVGMTHNADLLHQCIEAQSTKPCDVFSMSCHNKGKQQSYYCINLADAGLGGLVAQIVNKSPRWIGAELKYIQGVVRGFFQFRKQKVHLEYEYEGNTNVWEGICMSICMANGIYFGNGMGIAPKAHISDGVAELTIIGDVRLWDYIRCLPAIKRAERLSLPQVQYARATRCHITSNIPFPVEIDGEFAGTTPVQMQVLPQALRIYTPPQAGVAKAVEL